MKRCPQYRDDALADGLIDIVIELTTSDVLYL
jgi:hypothetical protein